MNEKVLAEILTGGLPPDKIISFGDCFVALFGDEVFLDNNVSAYDYKGTLLWNIADIIKMPTKEFYVSISKASGEILSLQSYSGIHYTIDLHNRCILAKEVTK